MSGSDPPGGSGGTFAGTARFHPLALLGRGNMGAVYRVLDRETETEVALKTLHTRVPEQLYRLKQEFRALADLTHRNLVELYELVVAGDAGFFTMELIDGAPFTEHVRRGPPALGATPLARLLESASQLVAGLAALHQAGTLHRDVKPSNTLVADDGRVVLLDFGLAAALGLHGPLALDDSGASGTLAYMSPEQAWGSAPHPAADWYSVGVLLFEALTGRLPFSGPPARMLQAKAESAPPSVRALLPDVPAHLDGLIRDLLNPEPALRPDAAHILAELRQALPAGVAQPAAPHAGELPFVGRRAEMAALRAAGERVWSGRGAVVHIYGRSGIGKSELVRRFLAGVEADEQALVLRGRCHAQESVPYKALDALVDGLSRLLLAMPEAEVAAVQPRHTAELVRLFSVLGRVPALAAAPDPGGDAEPHEMRRRGFAALRELLAGIAARRRLVLWIDDLQWGDLDSAALLRELLRPPDAPAMLVLLSYRSEDRAAAPWLSAIERDVTEALDGAVTAIELGPLDADETRGLAAALFAQRPDLAAYGAAIAAESEGSPFFVGQLVHHLAAARVEPDVPVAPVRLASVLGDRVERLSPSARDVLEVVSVVGRPLDRSLVLSAAGLAERGRPVVRTLEHEGLLRTTTLEGRTAVEVYHDRIREAIVARLPADGLRRRHGQIAITLERLTDPDPQELFTHYLGAGDGGRARQYGSAAADRAARALAFDRAAQLYRQLLELEPAAGRGPVYEKLGEALANGGRGGEAAESFEAAAALLAPAVGDGEAQLALRRRAAEQYLRSGHLDRGTALLRAVLGELHIALPRGNRRALAASMLQRARLVWRGVDFEPRADVTIPTRVGLELDACWSAATGLSVVDPIVSDGIGVRCLIQALEVGDRTRIVRALGLEAAREAALGSPFFERRSRWLLSAVETIARDSGDPYDQAWVHQSVGTTAYFGTRWPVAREHCDAGVAIWRARCRGAAWEIVTGESFALSALAHMGELAELARRLPGAIADADERGDVYAATSLRMGVPNMVWLAQGRAGEARAIADEAVARWPTETFLVQHYLHLIATVQADLYAGDAGSAFRRMRTAWPLLRRAYLLNIGSTRVELRHLRARAALAAACATPAAGDWPAPRLLRLATAEARRLRRERLPSARPFAALIEAGLEAVRGRTEPCAAALERAAVAADDAAMHLYAAAARYRAAVYRGGDQGRRESEAWMRAQGIVEPGAMAAMLVPGGASGSSPPGPLGEAR